MTVSKRLRFEILRRDEHTCRYCGESAPKVVLHVDHVVPVTLGGSDDPSNLVAACKDCNVGKSSVPADAEIVADVSDLAVRMAAALNQVAEMRAAELDSAFEVVDWFISEWEKWTNWRNEVYDAYDATGSIPQFVKAGLTRQEMKELIAVAMRGPAKDKWKYFCGCCWKRIRQNQELAAEIVAAPPPTAPDERSFRERTGGDYIFTRWSMEDINDNLSQAKEFALGAGILPEVIEKLACGHCVEGHCNDPLCIVEYASGLLWLGIKQHADIGQLLNDRVTADA